LLSQVTTDDDETRRKKKPLALHYLVLEKRKTLFVSVSARLPELISPGSLDDFLELLSRDGNGNSAKV